MLGCRTVVMAHSNLERDILDILSKSFKRPVCCQQLGFHGKVLCSFKFGQTNFSFHICYALFRTYSCFPQKCVMKRTKTESFKQVSCMKCIALKISLHLKSVRQRQGKLQLWIERYQPYWPVCSTREWLF